MCLLGGAFVVGTFVGSTRIFPYNLLRTVADKCQRYKPSLDKENCLVVAIFGDSLVARGDWSSLEKQGKTEIVLFAKGGLKASSFPYSPKDIAGDIHVFWLGTNDLLRQDLLAAEDGMFALLKQSVEMGKEVIVLGLPIPLGISDMSHSVFTFYNQSLNTKCQKESWTFIDTESLLNSKFPERKQISKDGVHLNLEASQYVAERLKKEIMTL